MPFTCPDCGRTSYHPEDEKNRYCGSCHELKPPRVSLLHLLHAGRTACGIFGAELPDGHRWVRLEDWPSHRLQALPDPMRLCAGCDRAYDVHMSAEAPAGQQGAEKGGQLD